MYDYKQQLGCNSRSIFFPASDLSQNFLPPLMHVNLKSNLFYITSIVWAFISLPYSSQHSATQVRTHISVFTERTNRRIKALVICFHSHANHAVGSFFIWELSASVMAG